MNHHYEDIRDKLGEPEWFDEAAVPRYCKFSPDVAHNIYAQEVALVEIACQNCGEIFHVAMSVDTMSLLTLTEGVEVDTLWYGDPPNTGCCPAGPTMTSEMIRVLQFWRHNHGTEWGRVPELERDLCDKVVLQNKIDASL